MKKQVIAFLAGIALTVCVSTTMPKATREVKVQRFGTYEDAEVQSYIEARSAEGWRLTALTAYDDNSGDPISSFMVVMERNQ
ncbi:hypothetical protein [uncultured Spirosoma sp.]|uniref:hypothetical protein n=1 Tax=uncultured Spirosoma sp. TaxID=278208 RepID=UPI00258B6D35|nr:hypothetical protein [uncultured Spirosoma sp.]